jgi:hypothetical protein
VGKHCGEIFQLRPKGKLKVHVKQPQNFLSSELLAVPFDIVFLGLEWVVKRLTNKTVSVRREKHKRVLW